MAHSADDIRAHVKTYVGVFVALLILTVVTVAVAYLHLPLVGAVLLALIVASVKGGLVATFFMHLKGEKPWVVWSLVLTAFFVVLVFGLPMWTEGDHIMGSRPTEWRAAKAAQAPAHATEPEH